MSHRGGGWYKNLPSISTNPPAEHGKEPAATFSGCGAGGGERSSKRGPDLSYTPGGAIRNSLALTSGSSGPAVHWDASSGSVGPSLTLIKLLALRPCQATGQRDRATNATAATLASSAHSEIPLPTPHPLTRLLHLLPFPPLPPRGRRTAIRLWTWYFLCLMLPVCLPPRLKFKMSLRLGGWGDSHTHGLNIRDQR